jgi:hypothetical protein
MLQTGGKPLFFGLVVALACQMAQVSPAAGKSIRHHNFISAHAYSGYNYRHFVHAGAYRHWPRGYVHVIQCVAFAKADAGIEISGNARDWWHNAAGVYARGQRPEVGSVLSFSANGRMPLGHVAVVAGVEDPRTIIIDQSHWNSSGVTRDIEVKDVSEDNDWSAVRVRMGREGPFGSIYPTHGFIYDRPDDGIIEAANTHAPMPDLDPAPADLRNRYARRHAAAVEVAEFPQPVGGLDFSQGIATDAPDRSIR